MALYSVNPGDRVLAADINQFYNWIKGVSGSGETATIIYNAAGALIFQPSSDPAAGTEAIQIKNNAGTVQSALSFDGRLYPADGLVGTPGVAFELDKDTGLWRVGTNAMAFVANGVERARVDATGFSVDAGVTYLGAANTRLISRFSNIAALNISGDATTAIDFGGSFTTPITTLANDKVILRVATVVRKDTSGYALLQFDRGGTKLPTNPTSGAVVNVDQAAPWGIAYQVSLEYIDTPGAGTFTYKPQLYGSTAALAYAGRGVTASFFVEVWR